LAKIENAIQTTCLVSATVVTAWTLYAVPSWQSAFRDPCIWAGLAAAGTILLLWWTRSLGQRGVKSERILLAVFLAAMPLVYLLRYFRAMPEVPRIWLWVELLGLALFGVIAFLGWKQSPWFLAVGIAAHGLAWDSWHFRHSTYIPDWYALACLLIDVTLAAYVVSRIPDYREARV
jgi:hypothetical protein